MTEEINPDEVTIPPFDIYPSKFFKLDLTGAKDEVTLTVKTWGAQFSNKPVVLRLPKEVAVDFLARLQKAVDGLI